jgi:hypothetical protein
MSRTPPMDPARAEELTQRLLSIAQSVFGSSMTGMIVKGSAIKGDFIPWFSDFDVHIFADDQVMRAPLVPDISVAIPFQERFSSIDVDAWQVSQIQVMMISAGNPPAEWLPPLPGSYRLVAGTLPDTYHTVDPVQFREHARNNLQSYGRWVDTLLGRIVDKPDSQLADSVRLAGTIMKAALYEGAVELGRDPEAIWDSSLEDVLEIVEQSFFPDRYASRYYERAWKWRDIRTNGHELRPMLADALLALDSLSRLPDLSRITES